jgi:class 3 adenylate cyclase
LAIVLIGVCLLSVVALGAFNYLTTRNTLDDAVEQRLSGLRVTSAWRIADGLRTLQNEVATIAHNDGVAAALSGFTTAFDELNGTEAAIKPEQLAALTEWYEQGLVADLAATGLEPPSVKDLMPHSNAGRYLQYHYLVESPITDDSAYREVHQRFDDPLAAVTASFGYANLSLVSAAGDVVYSSSDQADLGVSVREGPHAETALADVLLDQLENTRTGKAVFVDFERHWAAGGSPVMFIAATVRDTAQVLGAIVIEVPLAALNSLTTIDGEWETVGLGKSGEIYVVGPDSLLRSDSRRWLEDPQQYLAQVNDAGYDPELAVAVERAGSTVFLQPVETEPVTDVADGGTFTGTTTNYLGERTLTAAGPVGVDGLAWTIVVDMSHAEADQPLSDYVKRLLVLAAIIVPAVGLVGWLLATWLARPVRPLLDAADRVAAGDLDTEVGDLGRNEYGDLARRLNDLTAESRDQRERLVEEEQQVTGVLLAALPARVAEQVRQGDRTMTDVVDTATVVSVTVLGIFDTAQGGAARDQDAAVDLSAATSRELEALAAQFELERVRSASDHHLFTAGLGAPEPNVEAAAGFVLAAQAALERASEEASHPTNYRAGLSAGDVVAGMFIEDQLSYGVIGDPVQQAMTLDAVAAAGQILLDVTVADQLGPGWRVERVTGLVDAAGESIAAFSLKP